MNKDNNNSDAVEPHLRFQQLKHPRPPNITSRPTSSSLFDIKHKNNWFCLAVSSSAEEFV